MTGPPRAKNRGSKNLQNAINDIQSHMGKTLFCYFFLKSNRIMELSETAAAHPAASYRASEAPPH